MVSDRVWDNIPSYSPMDVVWGHAPAPNELHAALRQMSLGKAAGEDEVTAELLKFGGPLLLASVVRVCREQWLLLIDAAPGADVVWPSEWCIGLVVPLWKRKGNKKDKNTWRGITLLSVGSKLLARVVATRLRSWLDGHLGLHQFGFRRGKGVDDALQVARRLRPATMMGRESNSLFTILRKRIHVFVGAPCGIFFLNGVAIPLCCVLFRCCTEVRHTWFGYMAVALGSSFWNAVFGRGVLLVLSFLTSIMRL